MERLGGERQAQKAGKSKKAEKQQEISQSWELVRAYREIIKKIIQLAGKKSIRRREKNAPGN